MDLNRRAIALCMLGTQAEFEKRIGDAQRLYKEAWDSADDDYEKCIAAHYVAHLETEPRAALEWNLAALNYARQAQSGLVENFYPSLYVNLGHSYKVIGDAEQSDYYFKLAADLGLIHQSN